MSSLEIDMLMNNEKPIDETKYFARISIAGTVQSVARYNFDGGENHYIYVEIPSGVDVFGGTLNSIFKVYLEGEALEKWRGKIFAGDYIKLNADIKAVFGYGCDEIDFVFQGWYKSPKITVTKASDILTVEPQELVKK